MEVSGPGGTVTLVPAWYCTPAILGLVDDAEALGPAALHKPTTVAPKASTVAIDRTRFLLTVISPLDGSRRAIRGSFSGLPKVLR
jgi:hypothetical protein